MLQPDRRFFYLVDGGDWRDERGEWVSACAWNAGEGGYQPRDFPFLTLCRTYRKLPSEMLREPAWWIKRMQFELAVERQSAADRARNEAALRAAGIE